MEVRAFILELTLQAITRLVPCTPCILGRLLPDGVTKMGPTIFWLSRMMVPAFCIPACQITITK